jgi:hypothetical protein
MKRASIVASWATAIVAALAGAQAGAAPLVTGGLTIYYDFDNFTNTVTDGSGNGFNAKVQDATRSALDNDNTLFTTGVISNDTTNPKRGAGALRLQQTTESFEDPVFLDMDGGVIKATAPQKIPKTATTVAAWLNIPEIRTDIGGQANWNASGSILQTQTAGPSFSGHYQLEGDGRIRWALRGELQSQNIVNSSGDPFVGGHPFPNQPDIEANGADPQPFPLNEWFHVAFTYDKNANGGAGEFGMYYNGVKIRGGAPNGLTDGVPTGAIDLGVWDDRGMGDYFDGLGIGAVPDSGGRRLHGLMDEFYIFDRALSPAEIGALAMTASPGDFDGDQDVDGADFLVWQRGLGASHDATDLADWKANFGAGPAVGAVPEPSALLLSLGGMLAVARRRSR